MLPHHVHEQAPVGDAFAVAAVHEAINGSRVVADNDIHKAHIDHCGGCMADDGTRNFPNAQYYISQADYDFWTDPSKVPSEFKVFLDTVQKNFSTPNRDRIVFVKDGQEFLPGIQAIAAPGHTVGHTIFMISSGGKQLCYIGDLTHHPVLLMEKLLPSSPTTQTRNSRRRRG